MAKGRKTTKKPTTQKPIEQYEHKDKQRVNNPPVGLVEYTHQSRKYREWF